MSSALETVTEEQRADDLRSQPVAWYRTPLDPKVLKSLHERSDWRGLLQTLGYLGTLVLTGGAALYGARHWPVAVVVLIIFVHGMCGSFLINAVHELGHGTVFRTRWLNEGFVRIFAFLGWINFEMFNTSHVRHHQYTLHPPDDLEVVLPIKLTVRNFLQWGLVNVQWAYFAVRNTVRVARGKFCGEWELKLYADPARARAATHWARVMLVGHVVVLLVSLYCKWWLLPVLVSFPAYYGSWLFLLCNYTQHVGLQDHVPDFRLCCRTVILNPLPRFLYWQMNYHIEHHMYAAVPCYRLGKLHKLIQHDLPPCPIGLIATWKEIATIFKRQATDPQYQYIPPCPSPRPKDAVRAAKRALQPAG